MNKQKNRKNIFFLMFKKIYVFLEDTFSIRKILNQMHREADDIKHQLRETSHMFDLLRCEVSLEKEKADKYKNMLISIGDALPDMLWSKDIDGKYTYANRHIINNLLFSKSLENTIYKTDQELSRTQKLRIGEENHTFGEVCGNSDKIVLEECRPMKFLEYGKIRGKMTYLEVHKNVIRNDYGEVIGTVGIGRDVTKEYMSLKNAIEDDSISREEYKKILLNLINVYKFEV